MLIYLTWSLTNMTNVTMNLTLWKIAIVMSKNCQNPYFFFLNCRKFSYFFEKNENFWQFFWKKCQVFGNFFTFKWQFSGGSAINISLYQQLKFSQPLMLYLYLTPTQKYCCKYITIMLQISQIHIQISCIMNKIKSI